MVVVSAAHPREYVYGDALLFTDHKVRMPLSGAQLAGAGVTTIAVGPVLLVMVAVVEKIQPLASFTATV